MRPMKSVGVFEVGSGGVGTVRMAVRLALAVTLSYEIAAQLPRNDLLLMAPFTTLFVIHGSPFATVGESLQRMLGTCVGVVLATFYVGVVSIEALTFAVGILAALLFARSLPFGPIGQMQVASGALFVLVLGTPEVGSGYWRILDVVIGGVVGIAAAFILPPPPRLGSAERAIRELLSGQAAQLRRVAAELGSHPHPLPATRRHDFDATSVALGELEAAAEAELEAAAESLRFRTRARRNTERLSWLAREARWVAGLNAQIRAISGAVDRLYDRDGDEPALSSDAARLLLGSCADLFESLEAAPTPPAGLVTRVQDEVASTVDRIEAEGVPVDQVLKSVSLIGRIELLIESIALAPGDGSTIGSADARAGPASPRAPTQR